MNIANLLDANARRLPDCGAVALGARTVLTYRELALRVARLSAGLRFPQDFGLSGILAAAAGRPAVGKGALNADNLKKN